MEKNNYIPKTYKLDNIPLVGIESELFVPFAHCLRSIIKDVKRQAGWYHKSDTKLMLDDLLPNDGDSIVFPNGDTVKRNKTSVFYNNRLFNSIRAAEALKIIHFTILT